MAERIKKNSWGDQKTKFVKEKKVEEGRLKGNFVGGRGVGGEKNPAETHKLTQNQHTVRPCSMSSACQINKFSAYKPNKNLCTFSESFIYRVKLTAITILQFSPVPAYF